MKNNYFVKAAFIATLLALSGSEQGFSALLLNQLNTDMQMPRPSPYQSDIQLNYQIQQMFTREGFVNVQVDVLDGRVTLKGSINDLTRKRDIVRNIRKLPGITNVDDRITQGP